MKIVERLDGLGDAPRQVLGVGDVADVRLDDEKLVAADPADRVRIPDAAAQPFRHHAQKLVAGRMSE